MQWVNQALERFDPKLRAVGKVRMEDARIIGAMHSRLSISIEERAKTILTALINRAAEATPISHEGLLEALWLNSDRYQSHLEKRLGNQDISDANDYALKTFQVLATAELMTIVIADNDYTSGKLQAEAQGWIVLLGNNGHIITSHPFDPNKKTFEERHKEAGELVHDYIIDSAIRKILESLFIRP